MPNDYGAPELNPDDVPQPGHESTKLTANSPVQTAGTTAYDVYGKSDVFGKFRDNKPRVGPFPRKPSDDARQGLRPTDFDRYR